MKDQKDFKVPAGKAVGMYLMEPLRETREWRGPFLF